MKRWLPAILTVVFAAWFLAGFRPPRAADFDYAGFGGLPVLLSGRVQPWDSVARNTLLQIRNKQSVALEGGRSLPAIQWLLEVLLDPAVANGRKVFRIDNGELLAALKLPETEKHFSFKQLEPGLAELEKQARRANGIEAQVRNAFERQVMKAYNAVVLYQRLKNSLVPEDAKDFGAHLAAYQKALPAGIEAVQGREAGKDYDKNAYDHIVHFLSELDQQARMSYPLVIPPAPAEPGHAGHAHGEWLATGNSLLEFARTKELNPAITHYVALVDAYRAKRPAEFNQAVGAYQRALDQSLPREVAKGRAEHRFNQAQFFYKAMVIYLVGFLFACAFWFNWSDVLRRSGFWLLVLGGLIHSAGLLYRMILEGRPPVTNLYSSAIFIGWGAVVLGIILERFYRDGIGIVTASAVGFITLIIAHNLAVGGDTMEMMRAVLDTNFWLATHVVTVTLGYASTFVAGFLAIIFILRGVFTRSLSEETSHALGRMVYGIICFATLFSFAGTVLGGIWADQSWGRFWGWDPKENGALIIVLWNALILHARWDGMVRERGLMNLAIFGNIITSFSWFGVNMLGIGLHAYGFMDAAFKWLMIFIASQLLLIGLGLIPEDRWKSFSQRATAPTPSPVKGRKASATT